MQNSNNLSNLLEQKLKSANYVVTAEQHEKLLNYIELLHKWNQTYNLTSVRDPQDMITQHILDSLSITPYLHGKRLLDVGTGAGLPGIPLAITQPGRHFTLLDSNGKKTRFLIHAQQQLGLNNIEVVQTRVEQYQPEYCFDSIMSRAFSMIKDFLEKTEHLCRKDGHFLAMKGQYPAEELNKLGKQFTVKEAHSIKVLHLDAQRHLIEIVKSEIK